MSENHKSTIESPPKPSGMLHVHETATATQQPDTTESALIPQGNPTLFQTLAKVNGDMHDANERNAVIICVACITYHYTCIHSIKDQYLVSVTTQHYCIS